MAKKKPLVVITRKLPDAIETRLMELFDVRLNVDDEAMSEAELTEAVKMADVLVPTITDTIDAKLIAAAGKKLKLIANYGTGVDHIDLAAARAGLNDATAGIDSLLALNEEPDLTTAHACMRDYQCAKWTVNQNAIAIVSRAMDVCGGGAFMSGHELSRLYRDVRAGPFMEPFTPTETHEYIGQVALGRYPRG